MRVIKYLLYICLLTIILTSALIITGCTPGPVTTTFTVTATATETTTLLQIAQDVTVSEAYSMIQDNEDNPGLIIIDLRTPEERAVSYIEGSILLDWNSGAFAAEVDSLDRYSTYLLY